MNEHPTPNVPGHIVGCQRVVCPEKKLSFVVLNSCVAVFHS